MKINKLLSYINPWMANSAESGDIWIASIGRLVRNLAHQPFPGWSTKAQKEDVLSLLRPAILAQTGLKTAFHADMSELDLTERRQLLERKLISPSMAARQECSEVIIPKSQIVSVMLNEEEHLSIHSYAKKESTRDLWKRMNKLADSIGEHVDYAYDSKQGYLTSIPSECGDGFQIFYILHLPAMAIGRAVSQIHKACEKLDLTLMPFYKDEHEDTGHLYILSSLGLTKMSTEARIDSMERCVQRLVLREAQLRFKLNSVCHLEMRDIIGRALGLMLFASRLSYREYANASSLIRLGTMSQIIAWKDGVNCSDAVIKALTEAQLLLSPAHLRAHLSASNTNQVQIHRAEAVKGMIHELEPELLPFK